MSPIIRSEVTKLTTTPTWLILTALSALITVVPWVYAIAFSPGSISFEPAVAGETVQVGSVAPLFALGVGLAAICGEFARGTAQSTFLVEPRRHRVLAAKGLVAAVAGAGLVAVSAVVTFLAVFTAAAMVGIPFSPPVAATMLGLAGSLLQGALYAVLGLGLGAMLRNQTAAAVTALAWFLVAEDAVRIVLGPGAAWWLPGQAAERLTESVEYTTMVGGLVVLAASAALLAAIGTGVLMRRDIV